MEKEGEQKQYYPNGQLYRIENYRNGLYEGKIYDENGQLRYIQYWINDKKIVGNNKFNFSNGLKKLQKYWINYRNRKIKKHLVITCMMIY
jgi:antitoxin component YwqK of YwqJK toxin-antitoxin module